MAETSELAPEIFHAVAGLGQAFGDPEEGVVVLPVTYQDRNCYALATEDREREMTFVYALIVDEELLGQISSRNEEDAIVVTRRPQVEA